MPNKRFGFIAKCIIPKDTVILKEEPYVCVTEHNPYNMFNLIYEAIQKKREFFMQLLPENLQNYNLNIEDIKRELNNVSSDVRDYFISIGEDVILLYCAKFYSNAFGFVLEPIFLEYGVIFNHSCEPNVEFTCHESVMVFKTIRDVEKGEELYISYIDTEDDFESRKYELQNRYGFICRCNKCKLKK